MPAIPRRTAASLRDVLSHLTFAQAAKLLGTNGKYRLSAGSSRYQTAFDLEASVRLDNKAFVLKLYDATVTISLSPEHRNRLACRCSACPGDAPACEHVAFALSVILEEKTALGLAKPPPERIPVASLSEEELIKRALAEREERARAERIRVQPANDNQIWGDYTVANPSSGKAYRVSLRGWKRGESFCDCPDFRKNTLGTCKHIMRVIASVRRRHPKIAAVKPWRPTEIEIYLDYAGSTPALRLNLPNALDAKAARLLAPYVDKPVDDVAAFVKTFGRLSNAGFDAVTFPDALEYIQRRLFQIHMAGLTAEIRKDPTGHPLRKTLLKIELLPYQLDGIAFAAGAGRAVLADDMGLGKTIQGVGVAEFLARYADIKKTLIICPASLKSQWLEEIGRFSARDAALVQGSADERGAQYAGGQFFTICNYEQTLRDLTYIEAVDWDLIILDEAQRIKNWEASTTRVVKSPKSRFALALTGTPLENRLEELYTVATFVDEHRLGPAFRFLNRHRQTDDKGHVLGYKGMAELRERLKPILLRRTREMVMRQLPEQHTEVIRVKPSDEQLALHRINIQIVMQVAAKSFLTEMDLLRLRRALLMCRLAADGTYLVDKQEPNYSTKLEELEILLERLLAEDGRKIIIFSEWTTMLDCIEPLLEERGCSFARLDGSVPQTKRQALVNRFKNDAECKVFLSTNAGSTGLNLQVANTVINVDLPWNPAVLEQRVARAHRMGQKRPVQVYLLVTEDTLEERLLGVLGAKKDLALAALDPESEVDEVTMATGMDDMRERLEQLLGRKPDAPVDLSTEAKARDETERRARRERVEAAGGKLLAAAFDFLGEMLPSADGDSGTIAKSALGDQFHAAFAECAEKDAEGRLRLTVTLPDASVLERLSASLARAFSMTR